MILWAWMSLQEEGPFEGGDLVTGKFVIDCFYYRDELCENVGIGWREEEERTSVKWEMRFSEE